LSKKVDDSDKSTHSNLGFLKGKHFLDKDDSFLHTPARN